MHTGFWSGDMRERGYLEETDVDGKMIFKWILRKWHEEAWTGLFCIRIGTSGARLLTFKNRASYI